MTQPADPLDLSDDFVHLRLRSAALGYVLEPPPEEFATWDDWRRDIGLKDPEGNEFDIN